LTKTLDYLGCRNDGVSQMGKGKKGGLRAQEQSRENDAKLQIMQLAKKHPCLGREILNIWFI
jgi:hypothetical protein